MIDEKQQLTNLICVEEFKGKRDRAVERCKSIEEQAKQDGGNAKQFCEYVCPGVTIMVIRYKRYNMLKDWIV